MVFDGNTEPDQPFKMCELRADEFADVYAFATL